MITLYIIAFLEVLVLCVYGPKAWKRRAWNILITIDQAANVYAGGDPDETLSSRAAKKVHLKGWNRFGRLLEWIDPNHLEKTIEEDEGSNSAWK